MLTFQFRTELLVYSFTTALPILIWLLAWRSILGSGTVQGYDFATIVGYYTLGLAIRVLTSTNFENYRVQQIRDGKIDFFLLKPVGYFFEVWWRKLGSDIGLWVWILPILAAVLMIVPEYTGVIWGTVLTQWLVLGLCLLFAYLVEFGVSFIIVTMGFWFERAEGLQHFKWILISLTSGNILPFVFFPEKVQGVLKLLPFQYLYHVPIEVMLQRRLFTAADAITMSIWLACIAVLGAFFWKNGVNKYASSGG